MDNLSDCGLVDWILEGRKLLEPLRFFNPNTAQEKFIHAVAKPENKIILFPAGNWTGKTTAAIAALGAVMFPEQGEALCFQQPVFKNWEWPKRARIVSTPKELEIIGSVQTEIRKWWPAGRYRADKLGKNYPCQFITDTDWVIDCLTYDMEMSQFEGATVSFFIFNEPPPENIFNACLARMKFGGKILMPMTPLAESAWIYDRLVTRNGENGICVVYGATEENCKEHSANGVLPHSAIQSLSDSCDPDDREARLNGKFMHLAGQIYKTFQRDIHVVKLEQDLFSFLNGKTLYQVVDPAIGKPLAVIWAALDAGDVLTIYAEYPNFEFQGAKDSNLSVKEYVDIFRAMEENRKIETRILDRHFGNARRNPGGLTLKQEFGERGLDFIDSYSTGDNATEVETGILKVKDFLRYDATKPLDSLNRPRLQISETCINTIHALERWSRDNKTNKPKEEYKDFADVVRYLVMSNPEVETERPWEITPAHYGVNT